MLRIKPKSGKSRTPMTAAIDAVTLDSETYYLDRGFQRKQPQGRGRRQAQIRKSHQHWLRQPYHP